MAFNKNDKADGAKVRRGGIRRRKKDTYLKEARSFQEESQETAQSIREL